mgnify:CR=1 FL=1
MNKAKQPVSFRSRRELYHADTCDPLVAAARRDPPHVIGDGKFSVRELVDIVNADPRRGDGHATALTKIRFDDIAIGRLHAQDLEPESVPEKGRRVILRNNANLSTGGSATDVTDDVHPDVAARAVAAGGQLPDRGRTACGRPAVNERAISFGESGALFGILGAPEIPDPSRPAVLIPNTGVVHRVGPGRIDGTHAAKQHG